MTARNALVLVGGDVQELPAGDTLAGAGGGSAPPISVAAGVTYTVAANTQVLFREPIVVAPGGQVSVVSGGALIRI